MKTLLMLILAIILPPLGVLLKVGLTKHFWISVILTLFFWVPGMIHAFIIILQD